MNEDTSVPTMFDSYVEFGGIELAVDPIDRDRTEDSDNAMAIFYEEQPFMLEFSKQVVKQTLENTEGEIDFLDVGTGSGVLGLYIAHNASAQSVVGIDKSGRSVKKARNNRDLNGLNFEIKEEFIISLLPNIDHVR
jgi:2-polyprenyl-3-methyl-5-hydroxy-6-metoxy-1,4-benzoquinol methylase